MLPTAPPATCRRSRHSTLQPARASSVAATRPFGPAPITTASTVTFPRLSQQTRPPHDQVGEPAAAFHACQLSNLIAAWAVTAKGPAPPCGGPGLFGVARCLVRVAVTAVTVTGVGLLLRRLLRDDRLGRQQHAGDRGGVADRGAGHLHRVDDPLLDEVAVLPRRSVEALALAELAGAVDGHAALEARVGRDPVRRLVERLAHDLDAE